MELAGGSALGAGAAGHTNIGKGNDCDLFLFDVKRNEANQITRAILQEAKGNALTRFCVWSRACLCDRRTASYVTRLGGEAVVRNCRPHKLTTKPLAFSPPAAEAGWKAV